MINKKPKRLLVIIRKCGESTAETCKRLLCNQLSEKDRVIFCEDKPFYKTLIKSYEIAINLQFKWTLLIDADVLPSSIAIFELLKEAENNNPGYLYAYVLDYLFGGPRIGGFHFYKTKVIKEIYKDLPDLSKLMRPETFCVNRIKDLNHKVISLPLILGIHDYFQYPDDFFRKILLFSKKNESLMTYFRSYWKHVLKDKNINLITDFIIKKENEYKNKLVICDSDIKYPLDNLLQDKSSIDRKLNSIELKDVDSKVYNWKPEISYINQFPSFYMRLLFKYKFFINQCKIFNSNFKFLIVLLVLFRNITFLFFKKLINFIKLVINRYN